MHLESRAKAPEVVGRGVWGRVSLVYHSVTYINQLKCENDPGAQFSSFKNKKAVEEMN